VGLLRIVVVAADQPDVPRELERDEASPLRIIRATTLAEAVEQLYEEYGPRRSVRRYEHDHCATMDLLGSPVVLTQHYQPLSLLQEIKRERLPREQPARAAATTEHEELPGVDLLRWEEELREDFVTYKPFALLDLLHNFSSVVHDAVNESPRFVVLGPPGSGKTTLTHYLAWLAAEGRLDQAGRTLLPVRVRLYEWETWTDTPGSLVNDLASYLAAHYGHLSPTPGVEQWRRWLSRGDVLLLLDGLDEISGRSTFLSMLRRTLQAFSACPTVLTCRTVSFEQHRAVCQDFPLFTLAGLTEEARDAFIRAFPARPDNGDNANRLIHHLNHTPQLRSLGTNPLLLGILCTVARHGGDDALPITRSALYKRALAELLTQRAGRVAVRYPGQEPGREEKLAILQQAALALFMRDERRLTFTAPALGAALKQALTEEGYGAMPAPWANALRADVTRNSGVLRGSDEQGFFFLHLTIQEFLAASALSRLINTKGWTTPLPISPGNVSARRLISAKAWDPRWREVMIFLAGQLQDALPLLQLLADRKRDDAFHHRLALAALCLPEVQSDNSGGATVTDRIVTDVLAQWEQHRRTNTEAVIPHLTQALSALGHVNGRIDGLSLFQWAQQRLRLTSAEELRLDVVDLLGRLGAPTVQQPDGVAALVSALANPAPLLRAEAVIACYRIGPAALQHADVRHALERIAHSDPDPFLRSRAALFLIDQGQTPTPLPDVQRPPVQHTAHQFTSPLSQTALHTPTIAQWVSSLSSDDRGRRAQAAHALSRQGANVLQHPEALTTLIQVALHDPDGGVRSQATAAFGRLGPEVAQHPHVLPALTAILRDRDRGVRAQAATTLGQLGATITAYPYALPDLLSALRDEDAYVRFRAAEAMGRVMAHGVRIFRRWWKRLESKTTAELATVKRRRG
jgi:HEAT repeat protein